MKGTTLIFHNIPIIDSDYKRLITNLFLHNKNFFMKSVIAVIFLNIFLGTFSFAQEGLVITKYSNGKVESEINYTNNVRQGEAKFYYENGNLKEERYYVNGRVEGLVKKYRESGKLKELINIEDGKREGPTSIFDDEGKYISDINFENGKQVVEEKNPYITQDHKSEVATLGNNKVKEKVDYQMPPPESIEKNQEDDSVIFSIVEVMPEPFGGFEVIKKKLIYPPKAKEDGIQGVVEVEVIVDEYGEVSKAEVKKGIGHGCDESARIAVYYTRFKPGLQKGKSVKVQMIIPVEFKLLDVIKN